MAQAPEPQPNKTPPMPEPTLPAKSNGVLSYSQLVLDQNLKSEDIIKELKFYFMPFLGLIFFVAILVGAIIPNISQVFSTIDQIDALRAQDQQLDTRITLLEQLSAQNLQSQDILDKINFIVPTGKSEVVNFRQRIETNAVQNNVNLDSSKSGEVILVQQANSEAANNGLNVIEIPSEFTMSGDFNSFRNLLKSLYTGKDFFVIQQMSLSRQQGTDPNAWSGSLSLVKYQFYAPETFDKVSVYGSVAPEEQADDNVVTFLQDKFINPQF